jgi:hypothetical protein
MLTCQLLSFIAIQLYKVLEMPKKENGPFSQNLILLVRDMCQLPHVFHHKRELICTICHLSSSPYFALMKKYELSTVLQYSSDIHFLKFLNSIRLSMSSFRMSYSIMPWTILIGLRLLFVRIETRLQSIIIFF